MKGIHLVAISYVAILGIVALEASPVADILTECPPVNPRNETIFVPHETDCTKFYSCITGKKGAPLDCPFMDNNGNRLHFNPKLQVCDWPWSAGCQLTSTSSSSPTPTTPSPTTPSPTTPSPTTPSPTIPSPTTPSPTTPSPTTPSPTTPSPTTPSPTTPSPTTPSPTTPSPTTPSPTTPSPTTPSPTTPSPTTPSPTTPSPTTPSPTTPSPTTPSPTTPSPTTPSPTTPSPTTPSPTTPSPTTPSPTTPSPTTPSPTTPSPTTPSPTMSTLPLDSCESDGRIHMLPHKTKCDYYYLCFNGEVNPISQKCDRNLLFNPLLRVCDYPENVKCIKIPNTDIEESTVRSLITSVSPKLTSPLFSPKPTKALEPSAWKCERNGKRYKVPHERMCNLYYWCVDGIQGTEPVKCESFLLFNPVIGECDYPENVDCYGRSTPPTDSTSPSTISPSTSPKPTTPSTISPSTSPKPTTPSTISPSTPPKSTPPITTESPITTTREPPNNKPRKECPPKGSTEKARIAHPCLCNQYYECIDGEKILATCPIGKHFDYKREVCDWVAIVKCIRPIPTFNIIIDNYDDYDDYDTTCAPEGRAFQHETNCSAYYICSNGEKILEHCMEGLHFNVTIQTCDFPQKRCTLERSLPTISLKTCPPADSVESVLLPHECECRQYYECVGRKQVLRSCPNGLHFDSVRQICNDPSKVQCTTFTSSTTSRTVSTISTTTKAMDKPSETCPPKGSFESARIPHSCLCNRYYECVEGDRILRKCLNGMYFDDEKKICNSAAKVKCTQPLSSHILINKYNNKCFPDGRAFRHEETCTDYYVCHKGEKILKTCEEGLHFNISLQTCDFPRKKCDLVTPLPIGVCPPAGFAEKLLMPHECDCTKYHECVDGKQILRDCPDGLHYDQVHQMCNDPAKAGCAPISSIVPTASTKIPKSDLKCYDEDSLIPHEHDCTSYYKCSNGKKILKTCPKNLYFNSELRVCDFPENVVCERGSANVPTVPTSTDCPPTGTGPNFPHECDCTKYYKCVDRRKVILICPDGLHYDRVRQMCNDPAKAGCAPILSTVPTASSKIPKSDLKCYDEDSLIPHEHDCTSYYKCSNGKKILKTCPKNLYFNSELRVCDFPENVVCERGSANVPTVPTSTDCPPTGIGPNFPHECDCTKYYKCVDGRKVILICPDGLHYDRVRQMCNDPAKAGCAPISSTVPTASSKIPKSDLKCYDEDRLIPHEHDCTSYYKCSNGKKILKTCPKNLYFNSELRVCDFPENVVCERGSANVPTVPTSTDCPPTGTGPNFPHECDCTKYYKCVDGRKVILICPDGLHYDRVRQMCNDPAKAGCAPISSTVPTASSKIPKSDLKCYDEDRLIPHEHDCTSYYKCSNGEKILKTCPRNLYFNSELRVCDFPENVVCERGSANIPIVSTSSKCPMMKGTTKIPHETNCNLYYICEDGISTLKKCTPELVFNPILKVCDFAENYVCNVAENVKKVVKIIHNLDPSTCIGTCPEEDPEYAVLLPNDDCKKFCMCSGGVAWVQSCPEPLYFDSAQKICKQKRDAVCAKRSFSQDPSTCIGTCPEEDPEYAVLLPNDDCKKFCLCSNGIAWVQPCPEPLYFDSVDKVCKRKKDAVCAKSLFKRKHSLTINIKDDEEYSIEYVDVENNNKHRRNKPPFHSFNPSSCIGICSEYNPGYAEIQPNEDCKKFCLCNNGMTWIHSCPGSLYFDSVDRICKLKRNVICAEDRIFRIYNNNWSKSAHQSFDNLDSSTCIGTCPEKDPEYAVLLPNDDCKKFCMCSNGFAWVQSCPEPLYFDSVDKVCKTKRDAVCGVRPFNQRNTFTDVKVVDNDNSMKSLTNEKEEYETHDNLDPTTCIGTCPEVDPEYAVLLPNDDCKKFCMCSNGFAWVQSCPEPLYFDSIDKVCKTKRDAVCGVRSFNQRNTFTDVKVVDNDNSMKSLTNEKKEYETHDNLDPTTCIGTCPEVDPEYAVLLPNDDCKKFCMCSNGFAWVQSCPEPLYFDSVDKICKTKRDAVCGVRSFNQRNTFTDVKVVDNDNSMKSLTNENKEYETYDNLDPTTCIGTCPEVDPEYAVLLPNDDCKKFCMCSNGFAWVQSCPEPLYFDSVDKICKTKRDAVCGVRSFNQRNTFTDVKVVDNDNSMKSLTNEKEEYETHDNLDPTTCIGTCPEIDPEYAVLLPNDDCKKFCMCSNGFAWVQSCPEPLYFDSVDKICKTKRDAVCGVRSFNQRNTFTDVKVVDNDNSMKSLTNENKEYETYDNLDPTTCIGTCPEVDPEYAVLLPNDDCKKFCMCSNGFAWVQSCPEPLYFDSVDKICKTKRDAVCGVRSFNQRNTFTDVKVVDNDNSMKSLTNENKEYETYDNLDPTTCIGTCPEVDPEYAVLLPNDDCKKFCMCSNGFAWVQSCPEPLYFDSIDKVCKTKRDAVCGVRSFS